MDHNSHVSLGGANAFIMVLAGMMISPCSGDEETSIIEGTKDGVTVRVSCPKSFPSNRDVQLAFVVLNRSGYKYGLMVPSDLQNLRLRLTGPDGERITGYKEQDGWLYGINFKKRFLVELEPGEDFVGDSVSLSEYWPLAKAGLYRCCFTKRIHRGESTSGERLNISNPGIPIEIEVPEFTFRIESIDPTFKSPLATKPLSVKPSTVDEEGFMSPGRWMLCISLILTLIGIVLRQGGRKKAAA